MTLINKKNIIYLCILIIIILIIRSVYKRQQPVKDITHNNNLNTIKEGFENDINNGNAVDLLSKIKSHQIIENINNLNNKNMIKSWSSKIYNMMSNNKLNKEFAFYQPHLLNNQYCKLGDMISQNKDYSPPKSNQLSLLIKKGISDIKPPVSFDLVVNFGSEYSNTKYYEYETLIKNINTMNLIKSNINKCANTFIDLNTIITNNNKNIDFNLSKNILNNSEKLYIKLNNQSIGLNGLFNNNVINKNISEKNKDMLILPVGLSGKFIISYGNKTEISFTLPLSLNAEQSYNKANILGKIPAKPFINLKEDNITFEEIEVTIFNLVSILDIINYLKELCDNMITIYDKEHTNVKFLNYINLIDNKDKLLKILDNIEICKSFLSSYDDINSVTLNSNPEIQSYYDAIVNIPMTDNKLMYSVLNTLKNMKIKYIIPYITINITDNISKSKEYFTNIENGNGNENENENGNENENENGNGNGNESNNKHTLKKNKNNKTKENFGLFNQSTWDSVGDAFYKPGSSSRNYIYPITNVQFTKYDNNFLAIIPKNKYNIFNSNLNIKTILEPIKQFSKFQSDLSNNSIDNLPLKIYKPIAPPRYRSIGHIFCNIQSQIAEIKSQAQAGNGICCVPDHCVKDVRNWNVADKVFEYNKDNIYWAIYLNPYTGTFISTNTNQLPEGKVVKVVACVKKCTVVEELKKADECARKYYNINKKIKNEVKLSPDIVTNQEEEYYLDKIKAQSDSIARLSSKAQDMQITLDKANIVNKEMNKNKLQTYVDTQKNNIDIIMKRLVKDKNSIQTNINVPLPILNKTIKMIQTSKDIPEEQKVALVSKLINNEKMMESNIINKTEYEQTINKVLSSCPEYDLTGLVKKDLVSDVCYGCDM